MPWRTGRRAFRRLRAGPGGTRHHKTQDQTRGSGTHQPAARQAAPRGPRRFGVLLLLLIATYLMSAFTMGVWVSMIQIVVFGMSAILTLRASGVPARTVQLVLVFGIAGTLTAAALALGRFSPVGDGLASVWTGLVLLLTVILIVRLILIMGTVTMQSIFGAVSAYLMLGLMFAAFYSAMNHFGGHFFADSRSATTQTFQYFSFTTLTTLGYGDYTAAQSSGQAVAVIEALAGQVFLATLVARLVAAFRSTPAAVPPAGDPAGRAAGGDAAGAAGQSRKRSRARRVHPGIDQHGTVAARTGRASRTGQSGQAD